VAAVGLLGALLGLLVAGSLDRGVGPFEARMSLRPSLSGGSAVSIPPLGELQLETHGSPVRLQVDVVRLRERAARDIVADPDRLAGLGQEVQRDLQDGLQRLLLQAGVVTVVGATLLGFLVFRRARRTAFAGVAGLAALLAAGGWTALTFDRDALAEPRYTGLLASAPTAVGDVRTLVTRFDQYSQQLGKLVTNVSELYAVTSRLPTFTPGDDSIRLLHVSDLHLNPVSYDVMRTVVVQFGVDVVVDTGDLTDFGSEPESRYLDGIRRLGVPYVYARGNHDSARTAVGVRNRGGRVLEGDRVLDVAGVRFLGSPDPRFTPDKSTGDDEAPPEVLLAQGRALKAFVEDGAAAAPDVVLVHDPVAARPLYGEVPLILSGHTHRRSSSTERGTHHLVGGSTGGAGLRALEGEQVTPLEMSVLYLDRTTHRLQAYDEVTLGGLGLSSARIARTVVPPAELEPSPAPSASPP
jgi:predicted phosphodiesterase